MHPRGLPTSAFHVLPMYFLAAHRLADLSDTKVHNVVTRSRAQVFSRIRRDDRNEGNTVFIERFHDPGKIHKRAAESVDFVDHYAIDLSACRTIWVIVNVFRRAISDAVAAFMGDSPIISLCLPSGLKPLASGLSQTQRA
jgi:hypothetical protein